MKSTIRFSLNNKFAIWILTILVTVGGLYSGLNMKMETMPDITIPIVSVTTIYPGATPDEVMEKLTVPIEQRTRNLEGVNVVTSSSMENVSSVVIEYHYKKDMEKAVSEVNDALAGVTLPEGAQQSSVSRLSLNAFPILSLSVSNQSLELSELTKLVEETVLPRMQGISGVSSVQISGQHVEEVELVFDRAKMGELGISEETVTGLIQGNAITFPLGIYQFGNTEKAVAVNGNIIGLDDLKNLPIPVVPSAPPAGLPQQPGEAGADGTAPGVPDDAASLQGEAQEGAAAGQPTPEQLAQLAAMGLPTVSLEEIAELNIIGKAQSISRTNGQDSIGLSIVKAADANTVDVVNAVKEEMTKLEQDISGISMATAFDQGEPIEKSVHTMLNKALMGSLFAVLIILVFLRDIRSTIIAVVSIPLSILIALLVLSRMDITLNIMTLGAMTVAIGRVIDDSIVVIENIYRRMSLQSEKLTGKQLVLESTREMFLPIMASTIVTIAVFVPLGLVEGAIGEIFLPFALTIVFALLASLLVAITIVPMLAHVMFRKMMANGVKTKHSDEPGKLAAGYKRLLNWSLNHKFITFGGATLLLLLSFLLTPLIGVSFLASDEEKMMMITYNPAPGETLEKVEEITLLAEETVIGREGVNLVQYSVGGGNPMSPGSTKQALFFLKYDDKYKQFNEEKEKVLETLSALGGSGEWKQQDFTGGLGGSKVSLLVYGPDMKTLQPIVSEITEVFSAREDLSNVSSSLSETYEQYVLVADQKKLSQFGLAAGMAAMELSPARTKPVLTTIEQDGKDLNVYVHVEERSFSSLEDLKKVKLKSPLGMEVAIEDVFTIEEGETPNTITRRDDRIYAEVSGEVKGSDIGAVSRELEKAVKELQLPASVDVSFGGVTEEITKSFTQLGLAMLAAIAVVYLVLVITFGGGLTPFAILFSLPFTIIGALVALWIAGETISVTALIGALMLIGIVVTNAIVLIDRVIQKQKEGLSVRESLLEAAGTRLRPILMTALATIGALLPLAFGFESGGLISKGLGVTVIGGLTSSTLLTLIIVPVVYEFLERFRSKTPDAKV
ncbi:AcrB/AcrD/AcrF family protein [Paenibacillaceae bacterium]|nr:AcrB/AcrD/AcrF family protein [Paenibacillaceae bacterium]